VEKKSKKTVDEV